MLERLQTEFGEVYLNGHPTERLPHNLNISIPGIKARALIPQLKGVALATGSACTSAEVKPSHVIQALGFGDERAHSALRISVGRFNTDEQIEIALSRLIATVQPIRQLHMSGV